MKLFEILAYEPDRARWRLTNCWEWLDGSYSQVGREGRWTFRSGYCAEFLYGGEASVIQEIDRSRSMEKDRFLSHAEAAALLRQAKGQSD